MTRRLAVGREVTNELFRQRVQTLYDYIILRYETFSSFQWVEVAKAAGLGANAAGLGLLDDLVGSLQQRMRQREPERPRGFQVDGKREPLRLLDRLSGISTYETEQAG